jgi:hypothetical protein
VTLAVTVPERSGGKLPCEQDHKEASMNIATTGSPARILTVPDSVPDVVPAGPVGRGHRPDRSWFWTLVEALAYTGASIDPSAALAARRLAAIRDRELRRGHR